MIDKKNARTTHHMSNFDRQVCNALDKIHLELRGGRLDPHCRWSYNGHSDIYHCPHTAIFGKDLMARILGWQDFNNQPPQLPHEEHKL